MGGLIHHGDTEDTETRLCFASVLSVPLWCLINRLIHHGDTEDTETRPLLCLCALCGSVVLN
jgi:hypothetical protein